MTIACDHPMTGLPLEIDERGLCSNYELIIGSFDHIHTLNSVQFVSKIFDDLFQLIPEADKAAYYALEEGRYVKIGSKGYEKEQLSHLPLLREAFFTDAENRFSSGIEVRQVLRRILENQRFNQSFITKINAEGIQDHHTTLIAEIHAGGSGVGLLCIDTFTDSSFSALSQRTARYFAQLLSSYYERHIHQEQVSQLHVDLIQSLIASIEVNDPYTEGHGKRVGFYAKRLGDFLGLSTDTTMELETSGLLHDIGKIGIPTGILNKKEKLLREEYAVIWKHPGHTKKILEKINGLHRVSEYAYCHHERYDGNGYPRGLKEDEIPYEAQILSVADAFDAMTTQRPYRNALTASAAAEVILSESGKQFNPELSKIAAMLLPILHHMVNRGDQEVSGFDAEFFEKIISR